MAFGGGHDFKKAGIPRAGFEYQDLVAVETLIKFIKNRELYEWVQVEAEGKEYAAIDDVVACRKDGRLELTQVKFTPDPEDPDRSLSWHWLTQRPTRGKSSLQKWASTVLAYRGSGRLATSMLKTDRVPDLDFKRCLNGKRVDYERLTLETKEVVDAQIGSSEAAAAFFEVFEFEHSQPRFDDYEKSLRSQLENDTDRSGWAYFRQEVRRWAIRRNAPPPDGKIQHFHLLEVFSPDRPVSLRQDFAVPPGYRVPEDFFHREFIDEAASADGVTVLWGPPGRGKSTYLSHCVSELAGQEEVVCIRHHYLLRLGERADGRFSYFAIERSLIQQLSDAGLAVEGQRVGLADALTSAASKLRQRGDRLVVVIDGLDHVWRDQRDVSQLELLFDTLLPLPEGVRLLVGTQRVEDEHLPKKLLRELPKDRWLELPAMSVTAIQDWLASQTAGGRIRVAANRSKTDREAIDELASELHRISGGLPLHLVYSLEALRRAGEPLTLEAVQQLPACPSGGIEEYYASLWVGLSAGAKRVLHLLAGLKFSPPSFGLGRCLTTDVVWWQVLEEVGHMLDCGEASVVPFHGSLFAFLRDQQDHRQSFLSLALNVLEWLEEEAPEYWRRAWLWVMRAELGDTADLLDGPSRDWSIDWLASGYPVNQLVYIIGQAEEVALDAFDLPRLIWLRCLKSRALNARKYQFNEWGSFWATSLELSCDQDLGGVLWDSLPQLETEELPAIADFGPGVPANAGLQAIDELSRRNAASSRDDRASWDSYADAVIQVVARQSKERAEEVVEFAEGSKAQGLIDLYASESIRARNYNHVLAMGSHRSEPGLNRDVFAALCLEGIGPNARPELLAANEPAFLCLAGLTAGNLPSRQSPADVSHLLSIEVDSGLGHAVRQAAHEVFFSSLAVALSGGVAGKRATLGKTGIRAWLRQAMRALEDLAGEIGSRWRTSGRWPRLGDVYRTNAIALPSGLPNWERSPVDGVRLAVQDITVDLCLLGTGILGTPKIDRQDVLSASASPLWNAEPWLETFCERPVPVHSVEAAAAILDLVTNHLDGQVVEVNERATLAARAARFALDNGLPKRSREVLRKSADCLLGYGYHKDVFVLEVLGGIRMIADRGDPAAGETFISLAKEIEPITDYTSGDETRHARTELHQGIADLFPDRVPALYASLMAAQEWYRAENLANAWAERIPSGSESNRMFLETLISPGEFNAAWEAANTVTGYRKSIRGHLGRLTGRDGPLPDDRSGTRSSASDQPQKLPDVSAFGPGHLVGFVRSARELSPPFGNDAVSQWLNHWDTMGKHAEALDDLYSLVKDGGYRFDLTEALDTAFEISRKRQGRSSAYRWLILSMVQNRGWDRWWSSADKFRGRVRAVAQDYPEKWRDFVVETSRIEPLGDLEDNGIAVGFSRLVYFLVEVGESELAKQCAMEMVEVFRDEVSQQPLVAPEWAQ